MRHAITALALASAAATVLASAAEPGCKAWTFFWAGDCSNCTSPTTYGLAPHTMTQTGNGCQLPGCKAWTQGSIPTLKKLANGSIVPANNGGVPQRANLTQHLEALAEGVKHWIPDPEYEGNAVFDFEAWTPIYASNDGSGEGWHWIGYQLYSEQLVREAHPTWNATRVIQQAEAEFQAAGVGFFVRTLEAVRALRPKAKWGFYGFPQNPYNPCDSAGLCGAPACGYNGIMGPVYRAQNDAIQAVFNASTALFPSVYIPPSPAGWSPERFQAVNAEYVAAVTAEGVRLAENAPAGVVVRPYAWAFYHSGKTVLTAEDTASMASAGYQPPVADGVVLWGAASDFKTTGLMQQWLTSYGGKTMQASIKQQCSCSRTKCSGNGACDATGAGCECFAGYSGSACSKRE